LYAGCYAAVFCTHTEDTNLLSINYLHAGAPKVWYAVAQPDAPRFESLAGFHYTHQQKECKEFLRHKRCLLSPAVLQKAGIRYATAVQHPGEAIITFPGSYHFGFNAGFNVAEATNFGVPEWLPFGRAAGVCLCRPDSVRIDMPRLEALLQRYNRDSKRNHRLSWKEWRLRTEKKRLMENDVASGTGTPQKKKKPAKKKSEQEKKKEFWIEVMRPALSDGKAAGNGRHASKKFRRQQQEGSDVWHLAKPITRKSLDVNTPVLCLVPVQSNVPGTLPGGDASDEETDKKEDEQCFAGHVVEIAENHVRIRLAGLPKTEDIWMPVVGSKLFLDGGRWEEEDEKGGLPTLHYWKEADSKDFCAN
jgi:jumonji domain-containing protein 2